MDFLNRVHVKNVAKKCKKGVLIPSVGEKTKEEVIPKIYNPPKGNLGINIPRKEKPRKGR